MRGGAVAQLSAQDCADPQNHCNVPLFRQAPPQFRCGASTGSMRDAATTDVVADVGRARAGAAAATMESSPSIDRFIA